MEDWTAIVREHGPMVYQTAWRILGHLQETEDAVQDAFVEALRAYHEKPVANWGGLLRLTATHRALDRLRKRHVSEALPATVPDTIGEPPDQQAASNELIEWLRSNLARLPARQAEVFALRYFGELTNAQIASNLNITSEAVAVAMHKARQALAARHTKMDRTQESNSP